MQVGLLNDRQNKPLSKRVRKESNSVISVFATLFSWGSILTEKSLLLELEEQILFLKKSLLLEWSRRSRKQTGRCSRHRIFNIIIFCVAIFSITFWFGWLVGFGLTALLDSISVYIGPSPRKREKGKRNDRREKKCSNNRHPHLLQAQ